MSPFDCKNCKASSRFVTASLYEVTFKVGSETGSEAEVKVVGKAVNRGGGYGMEVPCIYKFQGHKIYVDLLKKLLDIDNNFRSDMKPEKDTLNWTLKNLVFFLFLCATDNKN
jgi:hypothetical protein